MVVSDESDTFCDSSTGGEDYCAWGTDSNGVDFCCRTDSSATGTWPSGMCSVAVVGGAHADTSDFADSGYILETNSGCSLDFVGSTSMGAGADTILGSDNTPDYIEDHVGGADDDTITMVKAENTIEGGNGNDTIYTGSGISTVFGGEGNDTISTGASAGVVIHGNDGNDKISGSNYADTISGDAGDDIICGYGSTTGTDTITGGVGGDTLWADDAGDTVDGGAFTDSCGSSAATRTNCELGVLTSRPVLCP